MNLSPIRITLRYSAVLLFVALVFAACKQDPCEDVICAPCPSSRLVIEYQDSVGNCPATFDANARIYALRENGATFDTLYSYDFSDSCRAGFLVQEDVEYHLMAPGYSEIIKVDSYQYQNPVEVTECCLCYPVDSVMLNINGNTQIVTFPEGSYENTPLIHVIN